MYWLKCCYKWLFWLSKERHVPLLLNVKADKTKKDVYNNLLCTVWNDAIHDYFPWPCLISPTQMWYGVRWPWGIKMAALHSDLDEQLCWQGEGWNPRVHPGSVRPIRGWWIELYPQEVHTEHQPGKGVICQWIFLIIWI